MTNLETIQFFTLMVFFGLLFGIVWSLFFDFPGWK